MITDKTMFLNNISYTNKVDMYTVKKKKQIAQIIFLKYK